MEGQSAVELDNNVRYQAVEMGWRDAPMAQVTWSRLCDGVCNRHMKNDSVRSGSILWKSHKLHETQVIYARARAISGAQTSTV